MKVKLLVPICGPAGSFKKGDTPDLLGTLAKALIKDGHAIEVEKIEEIKVDNIIEEEQKIIKPKIKTDKKAVRKR